MPPIKQVGAIFVFAFLSACASFPGGRDDPAPQAAAGTQADPVQLAALEAEIAKLKSQNARLANELLAIKRERDELAATDLSGAEQLASEGEPALPSKPDYYVDDPAPRPNAVVDDADAPALAQTDVPVETAPRLVQPTFVSDETVFENEAEGDIEMESVLFGVHLASYRGIDEARAGWRQLQRENPDELGLLEPRVESVTVRDKGVFLRLIGGGFASQEKAAALCAQLKSNGLFCSVASFEGERLSFGENGG
ncbi:MAG: SPOR domain-containing protein [Pseudomonadota bacterium]